jgi:hypothetical protein
MPYSAADDLTQIESDLANLLFSIGLDWADIGTITIDSILDRIRDNYTMQPMNITTPVGRGEAGGAYGVTIGAEDHIKTQHRLLARMARQLWYRRNLALGVS